MFAHTVCTYCLRCVPHVAHCSKRIQKDGSGFTLFDISLSFSRETWYERRVGGTGTCIHCRLWPGRQLHQNHQTGSVLLSSKKLKKLTRNMATACYSHATSDGGMLTDVNVRDEKSWDVLSKVCLAQLICCFTLLRYFNCNWSGYLQILQMTHLPSLCRGHARGAAAHTHECLLGRCIGKARMLPVSCDVLKEIYCFIFILHHIASQCLCVLCSFRRGIRLKS